MAANQVSVVITAQGQQFSATMDKAMRTARKFRTENEQVGASADKMGSKLSQMAAKVKASFAGVGETLQATAEAAEAATGGISAAVGALAPAVAAIGAVVSGIRMMDDFAKTTNDLKELGTTTGLTVTQLAGLQELLKEKGEGDQWNSVSRSFVHLSAAVEEAKQGQSEYVRSFQALGISMQQLKDASPAQVLNLVSEGMARTHDQAAKAYAAQELLGRSSVTLIPILTEEGAALLADADKAAKLTGVTEKTSEASARYERMTAQLSTVMKEIMGPVLVAVVPLLEGVEFAVQLLGHTTALVAKTIGHTFMGLWHSIAGGAVVMKDILTGNWGAIVADAKSAAQKISGSFSMVGKAGRDYWNLEGEDVHQDFFSHAESPGAKAAITSLNNIPTTTSGSGVSRVSSAHIATLRTGGSSRITALANAQARQATNQTNQAYRSLAQANSAVDAIMVKQAQDVLMTGSAWKSYHDSIARGSEIQARNAERTAEARVQIEATTGALSKHDAAVQMATIHAQEYHDQLVALQQQRSQIASDSSLSAADRASALQQNSNQQAQLQGSRQVQMMQDQQAAAQTSVMAGLRSSISQMTEGINGALAGLLTGKDSHGRGSFSNSVGHVFDQTAQGMAKKGLSGLENAGMKALGLGGGKPDGTRGNPIYTMDASSLTGSSASGATGLLGKIFGGGGSDSDSDGSGGGGFLGSIGHFFQGAFASGGDVVANRPALIGEKGPEVFVPHTAGRIIPNGALGTTHNYHIDARGSQDPALTEAAVRRALNQTMQRSISGAVTNVHEGIKRQPKNASF